MPVCLKPKTMSPRREIKLSWLTIVKAICLPLVVIVADNATDGDMVYNMWSQLMSLASDTTIKMSDNTAENVTEQHTITSAARIEIQQIGHDRLLDLFLGSCMILLFSILNLIFGN